VVTDNVDAHTGPVSNNGSTNDGRPVLSGSGEPGAVITLYDNVNGTKSVLGSVTVDPTGHWSFQPSTALSQQPHLPAPRRRMRQATSVQKAQPSPLMWIPLHQISLPG
jgi:hypothetical protein